MTPQQKRHVQTSWARLAPQGAEVAALFYARLFEADPGLRALFKGDLRAQGQKLMAALGFVVEGLDDLPARLPAVQALARRHVAYGVQPADYDRVGAALLATLREGLAGHDELESTLEAWGAAYATVAGAMKTAAWPAGATASEWAAQQPS